MNARVFSWRNFLISKVTKVGHARPGAAAFTDTCSDGPGAFSVPANSSLGTRRQRTTRRHVLRYAGRAGWPSSCQKPLDLIGILHCGDNGTRATVRTMQSASVRMRDNKAKYRLARRADSSVFLITSADKVNTPLAGLPLRPHELTLQFKHLFRAHRRWCQLRLRNELKQLTCRGLIARYDTPLDLGLKIGARGLDCEFDQDISDLRTIKAKIHRLLKLRTTKNITHLQQLIG